MKILIAFERSGAVREAFRAAGFDAWSNDLEPAEDGSRFHFQVDALHVMNFPWALVIAHPSCTYLSVSGLHWNKRVPGRAQKTEEALTVVRTVFALQRKHGWPLALENPISCISSRIRKPDQIIQPHQFGSDASKATCLWLEGLPPLQATAHVPPRLVEWPPGSGKTRQRWGNQCDSGQNKLGPSEQRAMDRSRTYPGIAAAMAAQWGAHLRQRVAA